MITGKAKFDDKNFERAENFLKTVKARDLELYLSLILHAEQPYF